MDPGIRVLMPDPNASMMKPAQMRPGYVLPSDTKRRALQTAVDRLLQSKYSSALSPAVNLRLALVDLTGGNSIHLSSLAIWRGVLAALSRAESGADLGALGMPVIEQHV